MRVSNVKRWVIAGVSVVVLLVAAWMFFHRAPPKPEYLTTTVGTRDIESSVIGVGTVQASKLVNVGAQASGQIKTMYVKLGDRVSKGQLVAEIDALPQTNALHTAESTWLGLKAQLRGSEASFRLSRQALDRQRDLAAHDGNAAQDLETAEGNFRVAQSNLESLQAQLTSAQISVDTAKLNVGYTRIVAPIDGVVVALIASQGQTVNANQSTPNIVKVANLDTVTVKTQISEADVSRVKAGLPAYFSTLGAPDHRYTTTVRAVEPAPDSIATDTTTSAATSTSKAIYYNALLDVPNDDSVLRISMTAQVNIVLAAVKQALSVPSAALQRGKEGNGTVRVLDGKGDVAVRKVTSGLDDGTFVEIKSGLAAGDTVVLGMKAGPPAAPRGRGPLM